MTIFGLGYPTLRIGLLSLSIFFFTVTAGKSADQSTTTPTHNNGKKWTIGYYEGGPYINYPANLKAIAKSLAQLGWIEEPQFDDAHCPSDSTSVWQILSETKSAYIRFDHQAYSSAKWEKELRIQKQEAMIDSLQLHQLDLIIAMGTWAGQDLANDQHTTPVMVVSSSDPIKSGIIKNASFSGYKHVHAKCDPYRYIRQVRLFHNIVGFKRLGIVYENSPVGRSYAAMDDIETVAGRYGFQIMTCDAPWSGVAQQMRTQNLIECHKKLAPKIDALYLTVHSGVDYERMDEILAPMITNKVPTWSQRGPQAVQQGVLLSIARGGFGPIGMFHAKIMAKIFNGANPGDLNQVYEDPRKIAINLNTAKAIGFQTPKGLMKVADEIYK